MQLLDSLNLNFGTVAINIAGFLLLLYALNLLVFKPVSVKLEERAADINGTYDKLDAERAEMNRLSTEYSQRLAAIEAEAREKIQSAIKDAQAARDQIVSEANARAREMQARAEQDIERERQQAMISVRQQVVELALGAATKIIGDGLDETRQRRLIDDFIETRPANGNGIYVVGNGSSAAHTNGAGG